MQKWLKEEIDFLKENYPIKGVDYCSKKLNRNLSSIRNKVRRLNLNISKELKSQIQSKNSSKYEKIEFFLDNPKDLYLMGYIWADGYLHDLLNRLELSITTEDFKNLEKLLDKNKWFISHRERSNRKPLTTIGLYQKDVSDKFREYGYMGKSLDEPNFLDKIPKKVIYYFYRGFFDGDGCFYLSKDGKQKQCYLAGSYEQNWFWVEKILNELGVEYSLKKKTQKNGTQKYSIIYIKTKSIKKFGDFIYQNFENY